MTDITNKFGVKNDPPKCQLALECKNWWMSAEWAAHRSQPIQLIFTCQKRVVATVNL
jgi:hypothetical protein